MGCSHILGTMPQCKHRIFEDRCIYCTGAWREIFTHALHHMCTESMDYNLSDSLEALIQRTEVLATRDEDVYVDSELQYILRCFRGVNLYDFESLAIIAERCGRSILDIIYIQSNYYGKEEVKHFNLRLRFLEKKYKKKEVISA